MSRKEIELLLVELDRREALSRADNFEPHEKQKLALDIFKKNGFVMARGGNRSGKTEVGAVAVAKELLTKPKQRWWVLCPSFDLQKESTQEKIDHYLGAHYAKKPTLISNGAYSSITLKNGSKLIFKSYEQEREKLQSAGLDGVWFDEEPSKDIFDEVTMRQKAGVPLKIIMTLTPLIGQQYIRELAASSNVVQMSWKDNTHLTAEQIAAMRRGKSERELLVREHGEFAEAIGRVVTRLVGITNMKIDFADYDVWECIDPGYVDPTAYVQAAIDADANVAITSCWSESNLSYDQVAQRILDHRKIKKENKIVGTQKIYRSLIDTNEPRLKKELTKYKIYCKSIKKMDDWFEYLASKTNWFFENDKIKFLTGTEPLLSQLELLYWKTKESEQILPEFDLHRKYGHHFDLAMALFYLLAEINKKYVSQKEEEVDRQLRYRSPAKPNTKVIYKNIS